MNFDHEKETEVFQPKPGDVVKLKSGGPRMTVGAVEGNAVKAVWFPDNFTVSEHIFLSVTLEIAGPD